MTNWKIDPNGPGALPDHYRLTADRSFEAFKSGNRLIYVDTVEKNWEFIRHPNMPVKFPGYEQTIAEALRQ